MTAGRRQSGHWSASSATTISPTSARPGDATTSRHSASAARARKSAARARPAGSSTDPGRRRREPFSPGPDYRGMDTAITLAADDLRVDTLLAVRCQLGERAAFDDLIKRWAMPL